jgi:hypothetical protein
LNLHPRNDPGLTINPPTSGGSITKILKGWSFDPGVLLPWRYPYQSQSSALALQWSTSNQTRDLHLYFDFHTLDRQISSSDNVIYNNPFIYIPLLQEEATSIMNRIFKYIFIYVYIYITARPKGCPMNFKKLRFLRGA